MTIPLPAPLRNAAVALLVAAPAPAAAQMPVFDVTNYSQNLLQAARALDQINNQVRSLQNEAAMLEGMQRNLRQLAFPELGRMSAALQATGSLIAKGRGIEADANALETRFSATSPDAGQTLSNDARAKGARAQLDAAVDALRRSMAVQSDVASNISSDAGLLEGLARRSDGASGSLEAQQATNQLLTLAAKQQLQVEALLAAEFQSASIERARRDAAESGARAATQRFLGSGKAYRGRQ